MANTNCTDELVGLISRHIAGLRVFQKSLGTPIQPRSYWLDFDYPDGPPREYVRSGYDSSGSSTVRNMTNVPAAWKSRTTISRGLPDRFPQPSISG